MGFGTVLADGVREEPWWWQDARPTAEGDGLPERTGALIVGSGYSGLRCALELARAGMDVTVVDAWAIGGGASSRAAGFVTGRAGVSKQIDLEATVGAERASAILSEADEAWADLQDFIEREEIDCDLQFCGRFVGAHTPAAYEKLGEKMTEYDSDGRERFRMVPKAEQDQWVRTDFYHGGMVTDDGGTIHPAKYHAGLVRLCRAAGVRLVPMTRVTGWSEDGEGFRVETNRGGLRTDHLALSTGGYTDAAAPWWRRRVIPISSTIIATGPLDADLVRHLIPAACPVIDTRRVLDFARPTPDGRSILFGGRASFLPVSLERKLAILRRRLGVMFPDLAEVELTHVWDGQMAFTFDFLPKLGQEAGVHYALACNGGSGIVMMSWLGQRMGQAILGRANSRSAYEGLAFRSHPFYAGKPWFLPVVGNWYRLRDWMEMRLGW